MSEEVSIYLVENLFFPTPANFNSVFSKSGKGLFVTQYNFNLYFIYY